MGCSDSTWRKFHQIFQIFPHFIVEYRNKSVPLSPLNPGNEVLESVIFTCKFSVLKNNHLTNSENTVFTFKAQSYAAQHIG